MREIKFRAWDKERKEMSEPFEVLSLGIPFRDGNTRYLYFDENPLMQFTGLGDAKGIEIYEGDILRQFPGFGCAWEERTGIVKYAGASFWFDMGTQAFILDDHDCRFEVIGNLYENPELKEGL